MRARRYLTLTSGLVLVAAAGLVTAAVWSTSRNPRDLHGADSPGRADAGQDNTTPRLPAAYASRPADAAWTGWTPKGFKVSVAPKTLPVPVGTVELEIRTDAASGTGTRLTVDLASPTMPMHGVTRFAVVRTAPGVFRSRVTIPMEGEWIFAVNVGNDLETAEVAFLVPRPPDAPAGGPAHAGHGP